MAVTTIFAGTADSDILSNNATYSNAANGTGAFTIPASSINELWVGQLNFGSYSCYEAFLSFDLTTLGVGQVVSSAVMSLWLVGDSSTDRDFLTAAILYDWGATVTSADWRSTSAMSGETWWTTLNSNGIGATGAYKAFTDTSGMRALCQLYAGGGAGLLPFVLASQLHIASVAPAGAEFLKFSSANAAGTTNDPKLTITHSRVLATVTGVGGGIVGGVAPVSTVPLANITGAGGAIVGGTAPITVLHGGGGVSSDIVVEWEEPDGTWSDQTDRFMDVQTLSGRDFPSQLSSANAGTFRGNCRNDDGALPAGLTNGRLIRVRTATSVVNDPVLVVRDRFDRADGALGTAETGQTWIPRLQGFSIVSGTAQSDDVPGTRLYHVIETGINDMYVQASIRQLVTTSRQVGIVARYTDDDNLIYCYMSSNPAVGILLGQRIGGVGTQIAVFTPFTGWEGMTIGIGIVGSTVTAYINGVPQQTGTMGAVPAGTKAGLYASSSATTGRLPEVDDFHVWDHIAGEVDGMLWTGIVSKVDPNVKAGPELVAKVEGIGRLSGLVGGKIASPRLPKAGAPTGTLVGDVLARTGQLHPPCPMAEGSVTTGTVGIPDGPAIDMVRKFEQVERGLVYETPEGPICYADASTRSAAVSQALFSDLPGWQFAYTEFDLMDRRAEVRNQVIAGLSPDAPSVPAVTTQTGGGGSPPYHVQITVPTVAAGDLLVVFIANSINDLGDWSVPIWWAEHRNLKIALGMRVYSHFCDGTESGDTVVFYDNSGHTAGLWIANVCRIQNWFESYNAGIAMSDPAPGGDPNAVLHGWGRFPTLFMATRAGIGATGVDSFTTNFDPPDGYESNSGTALGSGVPGFDVALTTCIKLDITEVENPGLIDTITGYDIIDESVVFAVRGYNGTHTKATLDNPRTTGGEGRFVTVDDTDSQDLYRTLSVHEPEPLFASEADANVHALLTLAAQANPAPAISLSFFGTRSVHYREQAYKRRVGHKVTVVAENNTQADVNGDYIIENIAHAFDQGNKEWKVTWELSPA